ncbi:hypothetical protein C8Q76DRAFT_818882 [Earliella scabrosa]|nr:hypothetical protein C8Q76DRAFT_818882 [Earliella scabrosa]
MTPVHGLRTIIQPVRTRRIRSDVRKNASTKQTQRLEGRRPKLEREQWGHQDKAFRSTFTGQPETKGRTRTSVSEKSTAVELTPYCSLVSPYPHQRRPPREVSSTKTINSSEMWFAVRTRDDWCLEDDAVVDRTEQLGAMPLPAPQQPVIGRLSADLSRVAGAANGKEVLDERDKTTCSRFEEVDKKGMEVWTGETLCLRLPACWGWSVTTVPEELAARVWEANAKQQGTG